MKSEYKMNKRTKCDKSLSISVSEERFESKVLVLYTGGTIGMEPNEFGFLTPSLYPFIEKLKSNSLLHDQTYDTSKIEGHSNMLVLPHIKDKKRILYNVIEYMPLLDSSNMSQSDWVKISTDIKQYYEHFDGFVILHGTDTLSYTASALSFMLENLGKPVIVTGSQISMFQITSDGVFNFIGSLIIAGNYDVPEVTVFFNNKLMRGNRTIKISSEEFDAFDSPNFPALVKVGLTIDVNYTSIFRSSINDIFKVESRMNKNVGILRIYPDISSQTVRQFVQSPLEGVVLQTYGSGNFPSNRIDLINELKDACDRGVIVVNCSQCSKGSTCQTYETGMILTSIGVIEAYDMTSEATLTKLSHVLGKSEWSFSKKKDMMKRSIRGELTSPIVNRENRINMTSAIAKTLNLFGGKELQHMERVLYSAMLQSAVHEGNIDKIEELRRCGVDLSVPDFDNRTVLHLACSTGQLEVVKYCLNYGVNIHIRDRHDMNPLHEAVISDQHEIICLLRKCGAHLTNEPRYIGDVLTNAAARGMITRLKSYLLAGADLNQPDTLGITSLQAAVLSNEFETVKFLLSQNPNLLCKNKLGQSALDIAKSSGALKIIPLLEHTKT